MINYKKTVLNSRVNTWLGSLLIGVWSLACGLIMWNASFDQNPVANALSALIYNETQL